jgi:hypothetical protein
MVTIRLKVEESLRAGLEEGSTVRAQSSTWKFRKMVAIPL